ncbi:BolA family protein [Robbsia sp. KACC 23696]|uniref:BolA family protein n=1 Tax=Robbsia sp. KACC 23696 TaxID=3149231 RepID=UPI00325BA0A7
MTASHSPTPSSAAVPAGDARRDWIEQRLRDALAPGFLDVEDDSGRHAGHAGARNEDGSIGGSHFNVTIVSAAFAGKSRVARHRLVYDALAEAIRAGLHALAIVAYTPEEHANRTDR